MEYRHNEQQINWKWNEIKCRDAIPKTVLSFSFCFVCRRVGWRWGMRCVLLCHPCHFCVWFRCAYQKRERRHHLHIARIRVYCVYAYCLSSAVRELETSFVMAGGGGGGAFTVTLEHCCLRCYRCHAIKTRNLFHRILHCSTAPHWQIVWNDAELAVWKIEVRHNLGFSVANGIWFFFCFALAIWDGSAEFFLDYGMDLSAGRRENATLCYLGMRKLTQCSLHYITFTYAQRLRIHFNSENLLHTLFMRQCNCYHQILSLFTEQIPLQSENGNC